MAQGQNAMSKGIVIYTIFVGSPDWEVDNALLMQWVADLTDNKRLDGDYSGSRALPSGYGPAFSAGNYPTENYYLADSYEELQAAYRSILEKIYTRLVN